MNGIAYPFAGPLGNGLRAAGDIRFTMIVSISLTIGARLFFSALFGLWLNMGNWHCIRHGNRSVHPRRYLLCTVSLKEMDKIQTHLNALHKKKGTHV